MNTFTSCITLRTLRPRFRFVRSFSVFFALARDFRCSPPGCCSCRAQNRKNPTGLPGGGFLFYREKIKSATIRPIGNTMIFFRIWMAGVEGFEPSARGFGDRCSTNWAMPLYKETHNAYLALWASALELLSRFELLTSSLPRMRSTNWAIAAYGDPNQARTDDL